MSKLPLYNKNGLVQNIAAAMQTASAAPINLDDGSTLRAIAEADASQGLWLQFLLVLVLLETRLATSKGPDCDSFGADFGFTRLGAVNSHGQVTVGRFSPTTLGFIPVGSQFLTADKTQAFTVYADPSNSAYVAGPPSGYVAQIAQTSITVPIRANSASSAGNVLANTITLILGGLSGFDTVNNANATTGGMDAETDPAFKARFVFFINSRAQGTDAAVRYAVMQVQQGMSVNVQENQTANGSYMPGFFVATVDDGSGVPPLSLVQSCRDAITAIRPIGSVAIVQAPEVFLANVSLTVSVNPLANEPTVELNVNKALATYVNGLRVAQILPYLRLAQVVFDADPNVTGLSGLTLNGGTADLNPGPGGVVRAGVIVVN